MGIVMRATGTVGALSTWHHLRLVRTIFGSRWSPEAHKSTSKMTSEWIRVARIKVASAQVDSAMPRKASISSTIRRLNGNLKYSQIPQAQLVAQSPKDH